MALRPGCGCLVIVLGLVNLALAVLFLVSMFSKTALSTTCPTCGESIAISTGTNLIGLGLAFTLVNGVVILMLGLAARRSRQLLRGSQVTELLQEEGESNFEA